MGMEDFSGYGAYLITPDNRLIDCDSRSHEFWIEDNREYLDSLGLVGVYYGEMLAEKGWAQITLMGGIACLNSVRVSQAYFQRFSDLVNRLVYGGAPLHAILILEGGGRGWKIPWEEFRWIEKMAEVRRLPWDHYENF
jgi:hypothetical protein